MARRLQLNDGPVFIGTHPPTGSESLISDRLRQKAEDLIRHRYYI